MSEYKYDQYLSDDHKILITEYVRQPTDIIDDPRIAHILYTNTASLAKFSEFPTKFSLAIVSLTELFTHFHPTVYDVDCLMVKQYSEENVRQFPMLLEHFNTGKLSLNYKFVQYFPPDRNITEIMMNITSDCQLDLSPIFRNKHVKYLTLLIGSPALNITLLTDNLDDCDLTYIRSAIGFNGYDLLVKKVMDNAADKYKSRFAKVKPITQ